MSEDRTRVSDRYADVDLLIRRVVDAGGPRAVFGEPVYSGERAVVPVAKVAFGAGGGLGDPDEGLEGEVPTTGGGAGGGFGVSATPVGYIEITPESVHFRQIVNWVPLAIGGMVLSALWAVVVMVTGTFGHHGSRRG
jgi:uncharacterized spore protein YtfJ